MLQSNQKGLTEDQIKRLNAGQVLDPKKEGNGKFRTSARDWGRKLNGDRMLVLIGWRKGIRTITRAECKTVAFVHCYYDGSDGDEAQAKFLKK